MELYWIIVIFAVYFLPSLVGYKKENVTSIFILNLFLGWTFIGWVIALVWAFTTDKPKFITTTTASTKSYTCGNCQLTTSVNSHYCPRCFKDSDGYTADQNIERFNQPKTIS